MLPSIIKTELHMSKVCAQGESFAGAGPSINICGSTYFTGFGTSVGRKQRAF